METNEILQLLRENRTTILWILGGVGLLIYVVSDHIAGVRKRRAFEESRREIAAYLAEGSITPEAAAMLLSHRHGKRTVFTAGVSGEQSSDVSGSADQRLAKAVSDWDVDKDDARRLIDERPNLSDAAWAHAVDLVIRGMSHDDAIRLAKSRPTPPPAQGLDNARDSAGASPQQATPFVGA